MKMRLILLFAFTSIPFVASEFRNGDRCGMLKSQLAQTRSSLQDIDAQLRSTSGMQDFPIWIKLKRNRELLLKQYRNISNQKEHLGCY